MNTTDYGGSYACGAYIEATGPKGTVTVITKVEALVGGSWVALERQSYNDFLASSRLGVGPFTVRVTDY